MHIDFSDFERVFLGMVTYVMISLSEGNVFMNGTVVTDFPPVEASTNFVTSQLTTSEGPFQLQLSLRKDKIGITYLAPF